MHGVNIEGLDLNLLVALRALLTELHVTRAAKRVGLSQPAMSHALGRLRELLADPILVRTPSGMQPTPRAAAMKEPLDRVFEDVLRVLGPPAKFDPARATRRFTIATSDYVELVLFPALMARLWKEAPGIDVRLENLVRSGTTELRDGRIDLAIAPALLLEPPTLPAGIFVEDLFSDRFVCVVRDDHPTASKRLSLDAFCDLPHALVSPQGEGTGIVDRLLARIGRKRRIALSIPHFLVAPHVVATTDVVLTLAARVADIVTPSLGLRRFAPPIAVEGFTMSLVWHEQTHADPAHAWLRTIVSEVAATLKTRS